MSVTSELMKSSFEKVYQLANDPLQDSIFRKEVKKVLVKKEKSLLKASEAEKIKLAVSLIKKGVVHGSETIDDVFLSLKVVGLPRTVYVVNIVYQKVFDIKNIYNELSVECRKTIKR